MYWYKERAAKRLKQGNTIKIFGADGVSFTWWDVVTMYPDGDDIAFVLTDGVQHIDFTIPCDTHFTIRY